MEPPAALPPELGPVEPRPPEPHFPLTRDDFTLADLLSRASEAWSRDLGAWVLAMILYVVIGFGIPAALGFFGSILGSFEDGGATMQWVSGFFDVVSQVIQLVLSAIFTLGFWAMALRGLQRDRARVGALFSQLSKIWKYIVQLLVLGVGAVLVIAPVLIIIFLAFVGPVDLSTPMSEITERAWRPAAVAFGILTPVYVYVVAGLAFIHPELAYNDDAGPIEAIAYSWTMARGKRWSIIGVGLIGLLITVGSAMLCGIGLLFGAPFVTLIYAALYLALRQGANVPAPNTATTLGRRSHPAKAAPSGEAPGRLP